MRIFRNLRVSNLEKNNLRKYLKYAIGEVVLLVIGILIAFQINNYRDQRNAQKKLHDIVRVVIEDLKNDTTEVSFVIKYYERRDTLFQRIIDQQVTEEEYDSVVDYLHLLFTYAPVSIDRTGFDLLRQHESVINLSKDSTLIQTLQFYIVYTKWVENAEAFVLNDVKANLNFYKENHPWFYKRALNDNTDFKKHVKVDPFFMNRVVLHHRLIRYNYLRLLKGFNMQSSILLPKLEAML